MAVRAGRGPPGSTLVLVAPAVVAECCGATAVMEVRARRQAWVPAARVVAVVTPGRWARWVGVEMVVWVATVPRPVVPVVPVVWGRCGWAEAAMAAVAVWPRVRVGLAVLVVRVAPAECLRCIAEVPVREV
jgi:hypothetical protein